MQNVWLSTHNENKKLKSAYEDAKKIAAGKPRGGDNVSVFPAGATSATVSL